MNNYEMQKSIKEAIKDAQEAKRDKAYAAYNPIAYAGIDDFIREAKRQLRSLQGDDDKNTIKYCLEASQIDTDDGELALEALEEIRPRLRAAIAKTNA